MKRNIMRTLSRTVCGALSLAVLLTTAACGQPAGSEKTGSSLVQSGSTDAQASSEVTGQVAQPEGYPSKTIEFIVPAAAGGVIDLYTRALTESLDLGTNFKISNVVGGSQTLGLMELAARPGDGYSIGLSALAGLAIQPQLVDVTYTQDSFRPVSLISGPNMYTICVAADSGVTDFESFKTWINEKETAYWTAPNAGSPGQLAGLYYLAEAGFTNCEFISYNGTAEGTTALLGGDIDFFVVDDGVVALREQEGQFKGIVNLGAERSEVLPEVPSAVEAGGVEGMDAFSTFTVMIMPAETPDEIYNWVKQQVDAAVTSEAYQDYAEKNYLPEMQVFTEQEMKDLIADAITASGEALKLLGQ